MNDTLEDTTILEDILNVPHCEQKHDHPGVYRWSGECSHEVVARFTFCMASRMVCQNTVDGFLKIGPENKCKACGKFIHDCWRVDPI